MARSVRTLVLIAGCTAAAACAHAPRASTDIAVGPALPALGEDLPAATATSTTPAKLLSIDTPVGRLCGDTEARAVVDRDLPGLTSRPEYIFFKRMTLRQLQAASGGRMTLADLSRVSSDLDALEGRDATPLVAISAALP